MWLLNKDRIQAAEQLKRKRWKGDKKCEVCGEIETPSHLIFECPIAKFLWCKIAQTCGWQVVPRNISDINMLLAKESNNRVQEGVSILIAAACWTVWLNRNAFVFREEIIPSPDTLIIRTVLLMQKWSLLSGEKWRSVILEMASRLRQSADETGAGMLKKVGVG